MQPGLFDPSRNSIVIRQPPGEGSGYWAGAPTVWYDARSALFYLSYRLRRPRGVHPDRGAETRIAASNDGTHFEDLWRAEKSEFDSPSIERCCLARSRDGSWQYFVSYVDPADGRWRTDRLEAETIERLDPAARKPVFTAGQVGVEAVKDPKVIDRTDRYWMLLSYVPSPSVATGAAAMHGTADVYNTGLCLSCSALASSSDGKAWKWQGEIMRPDPDTRRWDAYARRVSTLWSYASLWMAFYDGSARVEENYEERTGLAISSEPLAFSSVTPEEPALVSPEGTGSLRYVDRVEVDGVCRYYYEMARLDGSHDLRVSIVPST